MAWFQNCYRCPSCSETWTDEWSCSCDDTCPSCGLKAVSPHKAVDLTYAVQKDIAVPFSHWWNVVRSPDEAEHDPDYQVLAICNSERSANLVRKCIERAMR